MFIKRRYLTNLIRKIALRIFNSFENNNNANFEENGERVFIENFLLSLKGCNRQVVVFDVGANRGKYAEMMLNNAENNDINIYLHLFEPTKSCFGELEEKFASKHDVSLNNYGLSDNSSVLTIYYDKEKSGLASVYKRNLDHHGVNMEMTESINVMPCEDYIKREEIAHIDFIKIDIEGHEYKAFLGFGKYLSAEFIDFIQFEYGGANLDSHTSLMELYGLLESKGFVICKVMKEGLEIRNYQPYMENFTYSNYVAVSRNIIKAKV